MSANLANWNYTGRAINWIISYLTGHTQVAKYNGSFPAINTSRPIFHRPMDLVLVQCYTPSWKVISTPCLFSNMRLFFSLLLNVFL